jgi:hypothetical protein
LADHFLEPTAATGNNDHFLFNDPNPALAAVLVGDRMEAIVADYTSKVAAVYISRISTRPRKGDKHPGLMAENVRAVTFVGGHKNDRVVGEVSSNVEYAAADELGRHQYNPYAGSHDLRDSLYSVLPTEI